MSEEYNPTEEVELTSKPASATAVASAPTLEEEFGLDESMEDFETLYGESMQNFKEGEVVRGVVMEVDADRVLVDIGYKSEGIIPIDEFPNPNEVQVGDSFDVYIEEPEDDEGMPILSKLKADRIKNWAHIQEIYEQDGVIPGKIVRRVKGGLKVDIGIDAFMPASQLTWRPTGDLERYLGQTMDLKIIKLTKRRRNVVVSRRKLLEEQRADEKNRLLTNIHIGQVLPGEVKNITDFGAFVDVGGIDGLLHVTDMSWGRVKHPSQAVSVGQKIMVMVLNFDPQAERISLGLKQLTENPWKSAVNRYPVGSVQSGRVVSMTDYGAFVQLEPGIEGMIHVSEMSWTRRVRHPNEVLQLDDVIDVMILSVDPDAEKIALGIKQTQPNPWSRIGEKYPVGSSVKGIVRNLTDYGAFVQLEEGIDGLLHVSDVSWTKKVTHPSELLEKGQEIEVKVLSIDPENEKISVGLKQLDRDPWIEVVEKTPIGAVVEVEIAKLVSFGAFARLENGIEGLIHVSELADERVQKPEDVLKIGDTVKARVISIDPVERKIGLSIKDAQRADDEALQEQYAQSGGDQVNVSAAIGSAVPKSLIQAGRTLTDAANELMASVSGMVHQAAETVAEVTAPAAKESEEPAADARVEPEEAPQAEEPVAAAGAESTPEAPRAEEPTAAAETAAAPEAAQSEEVDASAGPEPASEEEPRPEEPAE
jgi:small subunit ribosomal protein S1